MEKYGFIYVWYDKKNKKFYVGRHWGTEDDGYICSSKVMREAHRRRPYDFKRRIVSKIYDKESLVQEEQRWLNMINPVLQKDRYYNKSLKSNTPSTKGYHHSSETKFKISNGNKGKLISEETREKLRQANLGKKLSEESKQKCRSYRHTDEAKEKIRQSGIGRVFSEESKIKIGAAQKGKVVSEETREKLRNAVLGKKRGPYKKREIIL